MAPSFFRGPRRWLVGLLAVAALAFASAGGSADVSLQWQGAIRGDNGTVASILAESGILSDFVALIEENFSFDSPLVLAIGTSAGPDFDRASRTLRLPYSYVTDLARAYRGLDQDRRSALGDALDATEYTLYFLLGQALANRTDIDNDAQAEALATWAMVSHWPNGGEQWLEAIDAFGTLSQRTDGTLDEFWHAHALYASRERELRCLAFGSNPLLLADRMPATADEAARAEHCVDAWRRLQRESRAVAGRALRPNAPLAATD